MAIDKFILKFKTLMTHRRGVRSNPETNTLEPLHSRLLESLHIDIRRQIYLFVLSSFGIVQHIDIDWRDKDRPLHMPCTRANEHSYFQTARIRTQICNAQSESIRQSRRNGWEILPLLLCCRQVYNEFAEVVYTYTTFQIDFYLAVKMIKSLAPSPLTPARLHIEFSVDTPMYLPRSAWPIEFDQASDNPEPEEANWSAFWSARASTNFYSLIVEIIDAGIRVPEDKLLEPLRQVKANFFEVVLPWPRGLLTSSEFEDVPFVVRRPPQGVQPILEKPRDRTTVIKGGGRPYHLLPQEKKRFWR